MEIRNKVKIGNKFFSIGTLKVLIGEETIKPKKIGNDYLLIAEAIDNPDNFLFLLAPIYEISLTDDVRLGLTRIQIDSKLKMKEDLEVYSTRLFVAECIEKILFGDLLIEGNSQRDENGNDKDKDTSKKSRKRGRRKKN